MSQCKVCLGTKKHLIQTIKIKDCFVKNIEACPACKGTGINIKIGKIK